MAKAAESTSMKPKVNRKVGVNPVLLLFRFVYHYAVQCHVQLCKGTLATFLLVSNSAFTSSKCAQHNTRTIAKMFTFTNLSLY